jgi:aryl-alcohol dehydrogenase-like predicted oxidoreductase
VLRRPEVSSAIIGASRPEQIEENIVAVDITLPEDVLKRIDQALGDVVVWS